MTNLRQRPAVPTTSSRPGHRADGRTPGAGTTADNTTSTTHSTDSTAHAGQRDLSRSPWLVFCPPGTVELRRVRRGTLGALAPGTPVALVLDEVLSRRRARRAFRRADVAVLRELIVIPHTRGPLVLLDDTELAVHRLWHGVATVPPGLSRSSAVATLALRVAAALPWSWTGALASGRVVIGVCR